LVVAVVIGLAGLYGLVAALYAPYKELVVLDTSGHRSLFEQPNLFIDVMSGAPARSRT
jgi:pimeloyl-ACP methyl ester carboxylesterase